MSVPWKRRALSLLAAVAVPVIAVCAFAGSASATDGSGDAGQDGAPAPGTTIVSWVMPEGATAENVLYPQVWDQAPGAPTCGRLLQIDIYRYDGSFKDRVDALTATGVLNHHDDQGLDEGLDIGLNKTWRFEQQPACETTPASSTVPTTPPAPTVVTFTYDVTTPDCTNHNKVVTLKGDYEHVSFDAEFPVTVAPGDTKVITGTAQEGFVLEGGPSLTITVVNDFDVAEKCVPPTTVILTTTAPPVTTTETAPPTTETVLTTLPAESTTATETETETQTEVQTTAVTTTEQVAGPVITVQSFASYIKGAAQYPVQAPTSASSVTMLTPARLIGLAGLLLGAAGGVIFWRRRAVGKQASAPSHR